MCRVRIRIGRRTIIANTIGYRGKREAHSDLADARQARALIVPKAQAKGLRIGKEVTVRVGRRKFKATVKRWSRGSRMLLPHEQYPLKNISPRVIVRETRRRRRRR